MKPSVVHSPPAGSKSGAARTGAPTRTQFSKVLEKKTGSREKGKSNSKSDETQDKQLAQSKRQGQSEEAALAGAVGAVVPELRLESRIASAQGTQETAGKLPIQGLVQEIWTSMNERGQEQVQIQLNSKVLDGLQIQITREKDAISLRFISRTDQTAQLLSRNTGALAASLAEHGVQVNRIELNNREQPLSRDSRPRGEQRPQKDQGGRQRR